MKLYQIIAFLSITLCFSCEEQFVVNCEDCTVDEPRVADLIVSISPNRYNGSTEIRVYEGDLEDNILFSSALSVMNQYTFSVNLNKKYTLTAVYHIGDKIYKAVDSAFPRVKFNEDQCDEPCYYVYDNKVNLKLKIN